MVFFTCDGCGENLKKSQVDAHAYRCRLCISVSCQDCHVSFYGDDYRQHTSCISEAERYEKTLYKGPSSKTNNKNKKKSPQEYWNDILSHAATQYSGNNTVVRSKLKDLQMLDNVPRKEKAFRNFTKNSLRIPNHLKDTLVTEIWEFLMLCKKEKDEERQKNENEQKKSEQPEVSMSEKQEQEPPTSTGSSLNDTSTTGKIEEDATVPSASISKTEKKEIKKAMKKILKKSPNQRLKVKELRRKVKLKVSLDKYKKEEWKKIMWDHILEQKNKANITVSSDQKVVSLSSN